MTWSLRASAKKAAWLEKLQQEQGIKVKTLENKPELFPDNVWIWHAFHAVSTTRDWIDGIPQRVKIGEIVSYCKVKQIDPDAWPFLMDCILMLDDIYTDTTIKERCKEATKAARKNQRKVPRRGR